LGGSAASATAGSGSSSGSKSGAAAALDVGQAYGLLVVAAAMLAGFGLVL
jgi:hypothetical protein